MTATGSAVGRGPRVVWAGGSASVETNILWGRGVVKGVKPASGSSSGLLGLSRFVLGLGLNLLGSDGRRGLNLLWNSFFLSCLLSRTSLRSVSSCSSSLSLCPLPDMVGETLSARTSSLCSVESSSSALSGTRVDSCSGLEVVDLLLPKMFLILSGSFLVLR